MSNRMMRRVAPPLFLAFSSLAMATSYSLTNLGDLPGGMGYNRAEALNNLGQVTGVSADSGGFFGYRWESGTGLTSIGDLPGGGSFSWGYGINDSGQVVGQSGGPGGTRAVVWDPVGGLTTIEPLAGDTGSYAQAINNSGFVVGGSRSSSRDRAFRWDAVGGLIDLGDLPGGTDYSVALGINNAGVVVGASSGSAGNVGFRWDPINGMTGLSKLPGYASSVAVSINSSGMIVGYASSPSGRAVMWDTSGVITDLGTLGSLYVNGQANGVNDFGQVVGTNQTATGTRRAFLWEGGTGMVDLSTLVDSSGAGWEFWGATDINNSGQIVGYGLFNGEQRAFLLTPDPIPEPATMTLLGLAALVARRRKKQS